MSIDERKIRISGMNCASCVGHIENAVRAVEGVSEISVSLLSEQAVVSFDPGLTSIEDVTRAVENAGYRAIEAEETDVRAGDPSHHEELDRRSLRREMFIALAFAGPLLFITMGHMIGVHLPAWLAPGTAPQTFALAQLVLTIPVILAGRHMYRGGIASLVRRAPNMDSLIAVGTGAALVYSLYGTGRILLGDAEAVRFLVFETAAAIVAFVLVGKYLEQASKERASRAISELIALQPDTAVVLHDDGDREVPIKELVLGDHVRIRPGERVPADAVILEGSTSLDEAMLTGESIPVAKQVGDRIIGGSVNQTGVIVARVDCVGTDTTLARIIRLVEEAQASKAPIARLADRVARHFVPAVVGIALVAASTWLAAGATLSFALSIFIAVLVVACPCALGLATPTAIMVGTGKGAELGVLIKGGVALERLREIDVVVLDKTGTLTEGSPRVADIVTRNGIGEDGFLRLAASVEAGSEHALGRAILLEAEARGLSWARATGSQAHPGRGIEALVGGSRVLLGNRTLMEENGINVAGFLAENEARAAGGTSLVFGAKDGEVIGLLSIADRLRADSMQAVDALKHRGLDVLLLTGDNRATADAIAAEAGIIHVVAEVLPKGKSDEIRRLQDKGLTVAMVGDGINDAPALAQADVGIAVGSGTDVAMETADVVLLKGSVRDVVTALDLSQATVRNIKQNLFWAFAYNTAGIPVAAGLAYALGGPLLNPMIAAAAMALSSVSVVGNALRLRRFKPSVSPAEREPVRM
jgi:Cu+-exporting ATPase